MTKVKKPSRETNPFRYENPKYDEKKYIRWVDPFEPINKNGLGSSRKINPKRYYD